MGAGVVASGTMTLQWILNDPDAQRFLRTLKELRGLVPGTTLDELTAGFDEARRAGGDFCLATHYWEVDRAMKDVMLRFLDHAARQADVRFVAAEELFA